MIWRGGFSTIAEARRLTVVGLMKIQNDTHMRHVISLVLENEAGALSRVSGLFSARGYNIESLTVAPTEDASLSRMTIVTSGSDDIVEQITKQLNKLVEVVKVVDLSESAHVERELMLVKVRATRQGTRGNETHG